MCCSRRRLWRQDAAHRRERSGLLRCRLFALLAHDGQCRKRPETCSAARLETTRCLRPTVTLSHTLCIMATTEGWTKAASKRRSRDQLSRRRFTPSVLLFSCTADQSTKPIYRRCLVAARGRTVSAFSCSPHLSTLNCECPASVIVSFPRQRTETRWRYHASGTDLPWLLLLLLLKFPFHHLRGRHRVSTFTLSKTTTLFRR